MRRIFAACAAAVALTSAACNEPFTSTNLAGDIHLSAVHTTFTGSPVTKAVITGTATNVGTLPAHNITVTAFIGANQVSGMTNPTDLYPGETASFSLQMSGDSQPRLQVSWN